MDEVNTPVLLAFKMGHLPNSGTAIFDLRKLEEYILDPYHPRGRNKARVFLNALGIGKQEASWLREKILQEIRKM